MSPLEQLSGTIWNVLAIIVGSSLGLILRGRLPERIVTVVMQAIGLISLIVGIISALDFTKVNKPPGIILGLMALAIGGALGEWWRLDEKLEFLGNALKKRFKGQGRFTEGFVAASLLFCIGPLAILGSIQNGLVGDDQFLLLKVALDGFSSLSLSATFGFGVILSAALVAIYQGSLALGSGLFASIIPDPASDPRVLLVNATGGLIIIALGLNLLEVTRLKIASFLPSLALVVVFYHLGLLFYH